MMEPTRVRILRVVLAVVILDLIAAGLLVWGTTAGVDGLVGLGLFCVWVGVFLALGTAYLVWRPRRRP